MLAQKGNKYQYLLYNWHASTEMCKLLSFLLHFYAAHLTDTATLGGLQYDKKLKKRSPTGQLNLVELNRKAKNPIQCDLLYPVSHHNEAQASSAKCFTKQDGTHTHNMKNTESAAICPQ